MRRATFLAEIGSANTTYFHSDHFSARLLTDSSGNVTVICPLAPRT